MIISIESLIFNKICLKDGFKKIALEHYIEKLYDAVATNRNNLNRVADT